MMETFSCAGRNPIALEVFHGYGHVGDLRSPPPCRAFADAPSLAVATSAVGIVVGEPSHRLGLAAYLRVDGVVRVVHEFLVHRELGERESAIVTDMLASAVEANALSDSVHCLMFMLWPDVRRKPFERRGYQTVVLDPYLAWLQKTPRSGLLSRAPVRSIFIDGKFREHHESPSLPRAATYGENSDHGNQAVRHRDGSSLGLYAWRRYSVPCDPTSSRFGLSLHQQGRPSRDRVEWDCRARIGKSGTAGCQAGDGRQVTLVQTIGGHRRV